MDEESLKALIKNQLGETDMEPPSAEHEENARKLDLRRIKPRDDAEFIMSHNPVYSELLTLYLVIGNSQAGLILGNYHTVITLVAHLYCEARRTGLMETRWPEMDLLIELHIDVLFAGKLPESAGEAYIRYQKLMGLSTTGRMNRHQRGVPYKEPQCKRVPFAEAVRPFLERETSLHSSHGNIESLVQANRELCQS
jgi:hypothetical protein